MQNIEEWIKNATDGRKNTSALFIVGGQGSGKNLFANALGKYVPSVYFLRCNKTIAFNAGLIGPSLVVFDEWNGEFEEVKPLITNSRVWRSAKGEEDRIVDNPSNYIFLLSKAPHETSDQRRMIVTNPGIAAIALVNVVGRE